MPDVGDIVDRLKHRIMLGEAPDGEPTTKTQMMRDAVAEIIRLRLLVEALSREADNAAAEKLK